MRYSTTILLILTLTDCNAQNKPRIEDNVSHGVVVDTIDSSLAKDIRFVHFSNSDGVIFPAEYAKQKFGKNILWRKRTFFTPDTILIKQIDTAILSLYCATIKLFNDAVWDRTIDNLKDDKKNLKRAKQQMTDEKKHFEKFCPQWQQELKYYDKHYIGYITEDGERVIYIQLLDFRQDP